MAKKKKSPPIAKKAESLPKSSGGRSNFRENVEAILMAVLLALFIRTFFVQAFKIPSGSMKETLQIGDHILVNKLRYNLKMPFFNKSLIDFSTPKRGDVVVFKYPKDPDKDYIKRVVGVPGDTIEIVNKKLFRNGTMVTNEPYAVYKDPRVGLNAPRDNHRAFKVPPGELFVMGDNRDYSSDSRFWGTVGIQALKGKAFIIYWSWDSDNWGVRWRRLLDLIR